MNKSQMEQELETIEWLRTHTPDEKACEKYCTMLRLEQEKYKQVTGHYYRRTTKNEY